MSEKAGPWEGAVAPGREEARLAPYLEAGEQLLWSWDQRSQDRTDVRPTPRWGLLMFLSLIASVVSVVLKHRFPDMNGLVRSLVSFGVFMGLPLYLLDPARGDGPKRRLDALRAKILPIAATARNAAWSIEGIGRRGDPGLHVLTDRRIITVFRDGSHVATPLTPGEPIIQYGKLRIDRPNHRGRPLIRKVPEPEQHRLFAALKRARAIREGRDTGEAA